METKFKMKLPFMKNSAAAKAAAAAHRLRFGRDPYVDWTVILALCIATTALCVSFAFALWHTVGGGQSDALDSNAYSTASTTPGSSLNMAGLQKVITVQSQKSSAVSEYENGYPGPADPSI